METKQIEIDCPHCATRILVDIRTQQVLRSRRPEELDSTGKPVVGEADWDSALGRVKERDRASKLDDLFEQAKERIEDDDDEDDDDD